MEGQIIRIVAGGLFNLRMPLISNPEDIAPAIAIQEANQLLEFLESKGYAVVKMN